MKHLLTFGLLVLALNMSSAQTTTENFPNSNNEIVLFTLLENEMRYEIRLSQGKNIKTYEIKNGAETYLGKFLSLGEVESSEPYKSLIGRERQSTKTFVTDGYLGSEFYEIYIHNLFNAKRENPIFVEVVKIENKKAEVVSKYDKETDFNESRFAPLIYRD